MMTIDEAIIHCEEVAEENEKFCFKKGGKGGYFNEDTDWDEKKCAAEHRQLAEWLKDYKRLLEQEPCEDMWEVSDGYHTFNQLYHQRAVLFATIVNQNKDKAWKSFKHFDGKYCFDSNGEWFIVGVDTPQGSYTYHYEKKYWDMFDCKELQCGKEWDGHTDEDVTRLLSLEQKPCEDYINRADVFEFLKGFEILHNHDELRSNLIYGIMNLSSVTPQPKMGHWIIIDDCEQFIAKCSECGRVEDSRMISKYPYCLCGAKMIKPQKSEE